MGYNDNSISLSIQEDKRKRRIILLSWKVKKLDDLGEAKALKNRQLTVENNGEDNIPCRLRTYNNSIHFHYLLCYAGRKGI